MHRREHYSEPACRPRGPAVRPHLLLPAALARMCLWEEGLHTHLHGDKSTTPCSRAARRHRAHHVTKAPCAERRCSPYGPARAAAAATGDSATRSRRPPWGHLMGHGRAPPRPSSALSRRQESTANRKSCPPWRVAWGLVAPGRGSGPCPLWSPFLSLLNFLIYLTSLTVT